MELPQSILFVGSDPDEVRVADEGARSTRLVQNSLYATDAAQASALLKHRPRLIVLLLREDVFLDILSELKRSPELRHVPAIVFASDRGQVNAAYDRLANCVILKPPTSEQLYLAAAAIANFWLGAALLPSDTLADRTGRRAAGLW